MLTIRPSVSPKSRWFLQDETPPASFFKLMRINSSEWPFMLVGCVAAMINGAMQPAFGVILSKIIAVGHSYHSSLLPWSISGQFNTIVFCSVLFFPCIGVCRSWPRNYKGKECVIFSDVCHIRMCCVCHNVSTGLYVHTQKNAHTVTLRCNKRHPVIETPLAVDHLGVFHFLWELTVPQLEPNGNMQERLDDSVCAWQTHTIWPLNNRAVRQPNSSNLNVACSNENRFYACALKLNERKAFLSIAEI